MSGFEYVCSECGNRIDEAEVESALRGSCATVLLRVAPRCGAHEFEPEMLRLRAGAGAVTPPIPGQLEIDAQEAAA